VSVEGTSPPGGKIREVGSATPAHGIATLRAAWAVNAAVTRFARGALWPALDLLTRLWLAQVFLVSAILKLADWQRAIYLATHEYPVSWMDPLTAASLGAATELIGGALLATGFLTRYASLGLLVLTVVIQTQYVALDSQLFWMALFGWYVLAGAGPLSLDHVLRRGLARTALPLVPGIIRATGWIREFVAPLGLSLVRAWLGAAFLVTAAGAAAEGRDLAIWLPLATLSPAPLALALGAGFALLAGIATRYVALLLMVALPPMAMMGASATPAIGYLLALLAFLFVHGSGALGLDSLLLAVIRRWHPDVASAPVFSGAGLPRIVIVGAGFGGLACANALRRVNASVTLIDRANYHLFQPLLYQVATAALSPSDVASPIRPLFREAPNTRVLLGEVTGIDTARRTVQVDGRAVPYDHLVLATGAAHSYFGKDEWAPHAPGLKRVEDATEIRGRILRAFEQAEASDDPVERGALLTFLVVGGGPTGVELAGAIVELARFGMEKEFRSFDPASARVLLVQSGPRLLPAFPEKLSNIARESLEEIGVEVRLESRVEHIDSQGVIVSGERITARTVLWAAGVMASPAAHWLQAKADRAGRVLVGPNLEVPDLPDVYAIGDTAASTAWQGQPVPGLAPAAKQGGLHVARVIRARLEGRAPPPQYRYRHFGSLATIGRKAAVADFGGVLLWGEAAWWLWGLVHIGFLVGLRNRLTTMVNWFWAYLTFGGGIRLITGRATPMPGESDPSGAHPPLTILPPLMTTSTRSSARTSSSGLPSTAIMSP
jgi:putative oxidoreductase